jgi:hypothetical protein
MKKLFLATAAAIALMAAPTFAGPFENITGCETAQADNSNFTVRVDPTCAFASDNSGGDDTFIKIATALYIDLVTPDEDEDQ